MVTTEIKDAMEGAIVARGCFIVDIKISKDNDIELTIESADSVVTLDDCVELSRVFESHFDREKEDYSLTVTSAGLDCPFKVHAQYLKALGTEVEVSLKGGKRFNAVLTAVSEEGVTLKYEAMESVEGRKRKVKVSREDFFGFGEVNSVRPHIVF
ncbi:MAG: ribosome assembly cofactor RimP [Candidatus Cryptobacteroides sp.]